jgi:hypothetical protein
MNEIRVMSRAGMITYQKRIRPLWDINVLMETKKTVMLGLIWEFMSQTRDEELF